MTVQTPNIMIQVARVQCECPMISVSSCAEQVCHVGASGSHKKTDPPDPQNMKSITNRCGLTKRDEPVLVYFFAQYLFGSKL